MHELDRLLALVRRAALAESALDEVLAEVSTHIEAGSPDERLLRQMAADGKRSLRISRAPLN